MLKQPKETVGLRLSRLRSGLLLDEPALGTLLMEVTLYEDHSCDTAWTDGIRLGYNPAFIIGLTDEEVRGLLLHEVLHNAGGHGWRRKGRHPKGWNVACDYAVNPIIVEAGYKLPADGLLRQDFKGKSAEWIYNELVKENEEKSKQSKKKGQNQNSDQQDAKSSGNQESNDSKSKSKSKQKDEQKSKGKSGSNGKEQSDAKEKDNQEGTGNSSGEDEKGSEGESEGQGNQSSTEKPSFWDDFPLSKKLGELRDPPSEVSPEALNAKWDAAVRNAAKTAQMATRGNKPGEFFTKFMDLALESRTDWTAEMWEFFKRTAAKNDYFFARPNTRYLPYGIYLPSLKSESMGPIVIGVDTSGSMLSDPILSRISAELKAIINELKPEIAYVVYCDMRVTKVEEYREGEEFEISTFPGGGGTSFVPVFEFVKNMEQQPAGVAYLTDLAGTFPEEEPECPVLWAVPEQYRENPTPWGKKVVLWN